MERASLHTLDSSFARQPFVPKAYTTVARGGVIGGSPTLNQGNHMSWTIAGQATMTSASYSSAKIWSCTDVQSLANFVDRGRKTYFAVDALPVFEPKEIHYLKAP